jgi:glycosyltransferase involved in cell wall biosynthesis
MRVLHLLSQRPSLTGSGVTLDAMVRHAAAAGWDQHVVVGVPSGDPNPSVGGLASGHVDPLVFGGPDLPFDIPGMSDVMPYPSTVFARMTEDAVELYLRTWRDHLTRVVDAFRPDVIHSHHVWLMSALVKDVAPAIPVVTQCHATGLRQMELVPMRAPTVRAGCRRNEAFVVLHRQHARDLSRALDVDTDRIHVVGAGYRDELFHTAGRAADQAPTLLYIGKYSAAKGLPWLLDAFQRIRRDNGDLLLHIAGEGSGPEADALRQRMREMAPAVMLHGQLPQPELAHLMRRVTVCVLPSMYEGLPLVLVEALACGCRLVATDLPGIVDEIAPTLGDALELVAAPPMASIDTPRPDGLPAFVDRLEVAIRRALEAPPIDDPSLRLEPFTWSAVFRRVERVWRELIEASRQSTVDS